ncbi:hypothetical protein ANN_09843 [Periplaneta americana]|uniref:Uncharacterized protein n=1 Tax=Periplaneta americana TaxID=6978 RepID=A0ABQ8TMI4_PERAM|nr:hypothetical protein ANN_09843 [Periplaneta americana]
MAGLCEGGNEPPGSLKPKYMFAPRTFNKKWQQYSKSALLAECDDVRPEFASEATSSDLRRVQRTALAIFAAKKPCAFISTASNSGDNRWRCAPGDHRRKQTVALVND